MHESFIFYKSFYEAINCLGEKSRLKIYDSIMKLNFSCYENVTELERLCDEIETELEQNRNVFAQFLLIKPVIMKALKAKINGRLGGAPKSNKNALKKQPIIKNIDNKNKDVDVDVDVEEKEEVVEEEKKQVFEKTEKVEAVAQTKLPTTTTTEEIELNNCFYGEYCNVYLDKQDYNKILAICQDKKYLNRLIDELSEKVETGKYPIYDEKRPHAHLAMLVKFHQIAKNNPEKFKAKITGTSANWELRLKDIVEKKIKEMEMERENE